MTSRPAAETQILTFDGVVGRDGTLAVPGAVFRGVRVRARLAAHPLARELAARGITREEIEQVARVQLAEPDRVARFLLTEGSLRTGPFARRSAGRGRSRR